MVSNQILQNTIDGFKEITGTDVCICDTDGKVLASTIGGFEADERAVVGFAHSQADSQTAGGCWFFKVFDEREPEYVVIVKGDNDAAYTQAKLIAFQLQTLLVAYKERFDKDNFIKNLLLDNLLLVDIYNRTKKLHIDPEAKRSVFIVETCGKDANALEVVKGIFAGKQTDFITTLDENNIVIIKEVKKEEGYDELAECANEIMDAMKAASISVKISYGTIVNEIKEVSKSYKEAKMALDVGKIFYADDDIVAYNALGIGRLIYQLPMPLCRMFIREIFDGKNPDEFDEETITTINKFFENSLNVSETSRQLYIHRNTLVYRLDKIQKLTGLDLRVFEDAITFKIALMVVKYMDYMEKMDY